MNAMTSPVDTHIGQRILLRRKLLKLNQTELGAACGISYQQVQKYEQGKNRVSASRLWEISKVLDCTVAWFFQGIERHSDENHHDVFRRSDVLRLIRFYVSLDYHAGIQDHFLRLMEAGAAMIERRSKD